MYFWRVVHNKYAVANQNMKLIVTFSQLCLKLNNLFLQYDKFKRNIFLIPKRCRYIVTYNGRIPIYIVSTEIYSTEICSNVHYRFSVFTMHNEHSHYFKIRHSLFSKNHKSKKLSTTDPGLPHTVKKHFVFMLNEFLLKFLCWIFNISEF